MKALFAIALLATPLVASTAQAKEGKKSARASEDVVREVERGFYLKSNAGVTIYLNHYLQGLVQSGTALNLSVGQDLLDKERLSAGWEFTFAQSLNNGALWQDQVGLTPDVLTQGDIHTFSTYVTGEVSAYPSRRFGVGARLGGGVTFAPLLLDPTAYNDQVATQWGGFAQIHEGPKPMVVGGPTFEYYTKLSHFSIGAEIDAFYLLGFDLGITGSGYLKYTF